MIGPLAKFRGTPMEANTPSPALGQHSSEILKDLGFSGEDIARWKEAGILV
jgi:crotonobetainyl-CoA:carnitine CoA-transferase CaiB-like acyl-CoA transferase